MNGIFVSDLLKRSRACVGSGVELQLTGSIGEAAQSVWLEERAVLREIRRYALV